MKNYAYYFISFTICIHACLVELHGQVNLASTAVASSDTSIFEHPVKAVVDGDITDGMGWMAPALVSENMDETNIALSATASASTYHTANGGRPPKDAIDGITGAWTGWEASATYDNLPQWLELNWPSAQRVHKVVLYTNPHGDGDYAIQGYMVQYWNGTDYIDLDTITENFSEVVTSVFDTVTTTRIRIYCTESDISSSFYRVSELEVYSSASIQTHYIDLGWSAEQSVNKVVLYTSSNPDLALRAFDIQYWNGNAFNTITSINDNTEAKVVSYFDSVSTSIIRILCTHSDHAGEWYRINEIEVYYEVVPALDDSTWNHGFETIDYYFNDPPNEYRIIDYSSGFQQSDVEELKEYGFGGVQTHVAYNNYLQDESKWNILVSDVDLANENDMEVWIHDERGYPTGAAGGLVVEDHPEYENRGIIRITESGIGAESIDLQLPADIEFIYASLSRVVNSEPDYENARRVSINDHQIDTTGLDGPWQLSVFGVKILDEDTQAQSTPQFGASGHYPSLLNKEAVRRFLDLTHQNYADHLNDIGEKVEIFYTNEANLMTTYWQYDGTQAEYAYLPWDDDLPEQFLSMHGYQLITRLDALFGGYSAESKMVRLHFYQTVGEVMARNFSGQIAEWCQENGVKLSGHPLLEEYMICHAIYYGDFMKVMRKYHVPSCDLPIARPDNTNWNFWMPKFLSSAAYLENNYGMVAALIDPIIFYGTEDLSPDIPYLRRTFNMSLLCGINQFSSYIPFEDYKGEEKVEFAALSDYLSRISLMLRGAKNEASIAMFYPIESFQSSYIASPKPHNKIVQNYAYLQSTLDRLAVDLLQKGLDFNYITSDAILNATLVGNQIQVGTHMYSSIIMPKVTVISLEVLERLKTISAAGVSVFWVDMAPSLGIVNNEHEAVKQISSTLKTTVNPIPDLQIQSEKEFSVKVSSSADKLYMSRFTRDGQRVYYIINESENEITVTAESEMTDTLQVYNPVDGSIKVVDLPFSEKIGRYKSLFLVEEMSAIDNGPLNVDAGLDTILCESDFREYRMGDFVSIAGGSPPCSFSWTSSNIGQAGTYASMFLNDTAISNPMFIDSFDTLNLKLEVIDKSGNTASDSIVVVISRFNYCLSECTASIPAGDSIRLSHCISGGILPYTFSWDQSATLSDSGVANPWARPDSTTIYTLTLTDAAGCVASNVCMISVLPTGLDETALINDRIRIYPNPARASVFIEVPDRFKGDVLEVRDIAGKVKEYRKITGGLTTIDLHSYRSGVYYIGIPGKMRFIKLLHD